MPATFDDNVGVRILRLAEVYSRLAKIGVEQPWGLRSTDLRILNVLDATGSMAISEIARRTHVDKAWISRSIRQLEDKLLVERRLDSYDSRVTLAVLTPKGRALLEEIRPEVLINEKRVLEGIDERQFKHYLDVLLVNAVAMLDKAETGEWKPGT